MLDALIVLAIMTAVVVGVLLALAAYTLVPLVLTLNEAERRGRDVHLWGALVLVMCVLGGGLALLGRENVLMLGFTVLGWVPFLALVSIPRRGPATAADDGADVQAAGMPSG